MLNTKDFRIWLETFWMENCEERICWGEPRLTQADFFQMYKWVLRREFRHAQSVAKNQQNTKQS